MSAPTFIDLFSGCGGFSLGMLRAGFECLAAVDFNTEAIDTLRQNLQTDRPTGLKPVGFAMKADLTELSPEVLSSVVGRNSVDVIVGGPPCQGFSTARQRDGSNHGSERLKDDPRRHLFRQFLRHVDHFQPRVFVIENVLGLRSAAGGQYFTAVQHEARILGRDEGRLGYRVHSQIEEGVKLGVPQKRRRQLIVGVRADLPGYFPTDLVRAHRAPANTMLGDAIGDLPPLEAGAGQQSVAYDINRRNKIFYNGTRNTIRRRFLSSVAEVDWATKIFNHVARPHSDRDLRDFRLLREGTSSAELMRKGIKFEFPYDKTTFKDRYTRQHRRRPCSTIVAHLSKDGLMFIHPTQNRSLTAREAARVQTFPDWFVFPEARTHSYRLIGNAVPPLIGEAVGIAILNFLHSTTDSTPNFAPKVQVPDGFALPQNQADAIKRLDPLTRVDKHQLRTMPCQEFLSAWHALLWLFPDLHPDNALEHGDESYGEGWSENDVDCFGRRFTRSGWPVMLEAFGKEAWRRFNKNQFSKDAFYCVEAQKAGLLARSTSTTSLLKRGHSSPISKPAQ